MKSWIEFYLRAVRVKKFCHIAAQLLLLFMFVIRGAQRLLAAGFSNKSSKVLRVFFLFTGYLRALQSFVEGQAQHFAQCHMNMQDLQKQLAR